MSARKAERLAVKELVRTDRTWTLDNVFEYGREDPSAGKRGHPAAQQNPVTPDREKRRDHDTNDRHREGRAQNANCRKDLVTQVCCVTPEKTKSGDVKLCQRIVMENILRYTPKQQRPATLMSRPMVKWRPRYSPRANRAAMKIQSLGYPSRTRLRLAEASTCC